MRNFYKNLFTISANVVQTRRKWSKKRSLFDINEYFEAIFNAVSTSTARSRTGSNEVLIKSGLLEKITGKVFNSSAA